MASLKVNRGRTLARSQALQILFQSEMRKVSVEDVLAGDYTLSKGPLAPYAIEIARGVSANRDRIDSALRAVSANWTLERMPGADRNLLRAAVYELYFQVADTLDAAVVINEAVEIAKAYGTDESAGFVNGVLGRIVRDRHLPSLQHVACTITAEDAEAACLAALWFEIDPKRLAAEEEAARAALAKVVHIPVDDIRGAPGGLEQAPVYAEAAAAGEASGGVKTAAAGVKEGKGGVVEQGAGGIVEDGVDILSHVGVAGVQGAADPSAAPEAVHHLSAGVQQAVQVAAQGVQLRLGGIGHAAVKGGLEDAQHEDGTQQQWHHADQQEAHQQLGAEGAVEKVPHARSSPHSASHRAVNSSFSPAAQWTS